MNHNQVRDLLPGYVFGALETSEHQAVSDHIQQCDSCFELVQQALDVAGLLAGGVEWVDPPLELLGRVQSSIANLSAPGVGRPLAPRAQILSRPGFLGRWRVLAAAGAAVLGVLAIGAILAMAVTSTGSLAQVRNETRSLVAKVDQQKAALDSSQEALAELRKDNRSLAAKADDQREVMVRSEEELSRLRQQSQGLAAELDAQKAASAAAQSQLTDLRRRNEALKAQINNQQTMAYLQALPVNHRIVLKPTKEAPSVNTRGLMLANPDKTWGVVLLLAMDPLGTGSGYQIWLEKDGEAVSAGIITEVEPMTGFGQLYITSFPEALTNFSSAFVTTEPAVGSRAPTGAPLLRAPLK